MPNRREEGERKESRKARPNYCYYSEGLDMLSLRNSTKCVPENSLMKVEA
jgi:hypothetical protein